MGSIEGRKLREEILYFKDDILKDLKKTESTISTKYDVQKNGLSDRLHRIECRLDALTNKIFQLSEEVQADDEMKQKIHKLSITNDKLGNSLISQTTRINTMGIELRDAINKYDKILSESVIYPGVIGYNTKYKSFHALIDYILTIILALM